MPIFIPENKSESNKPDYILSANEAGACFNNIQCPNRDSNKKDKAWLTKTRQPE